MESTEQEIYDQSLVEQTENIPETPVEAPSEARAERVRDDKGRYASATPEPTSQEESVAEAPIEQPPVEKEDARVPSWRLAEEADRRRHAEQALQELRSEIRQMQMAQQSQMYQQQAAPQEAPDIFADPQGFVQQLQQAQHREIATMRLEWSLKDAHRTHGDRFNEAYDAFTNHVSKTRDQATYQRVMASHDPGESLVQWYKDQTLQKELGGSDLQTFLAKQRDEWLKDPQVQAKVIEAFKATQNAQSPSNLTNLPPSLNKAASARSAHDEGGSSGADMYSYATKR